MHNAQFAALSLCSILLIYRIAKNFVTKNFAIYHKCTLKKQGSLIVDIKIKKDL